MGGTGGDQGVPRRVEVAYGHGYDARTRELVDPIPASLARERDHTGLPYVVLLAMPVISSRSAR
jgi:hypothetical protein